MLPGNNQFSAFHHASPDLLILGGGINGAAILREASARGYSCLLIDKYDFASGASGHSSHLIHGGLRYLEFGEIDLVYESLHAREWILSEFPEFTKVIPLVIPTSKNASRPRWMLKLGLTAYDFLARSKKVPTHNWLSKEEIIDRFDGIKSSGLTGGYQYFDGMVEWPERLILDLLKRSGSPAFNYVDLVRKNEQGILLRQQFSGEEILIHPKKIINATGAWVDFTNVSLGIKTTYMGGTAGSHLVVSFPGKLPESGIYTETGSDHRPIFWLPWAGKILFGTTDIRYNGNPSFVTVTNEEISYLKEALNELFPGLGSEAIEFSFCAVRPLPATPLNRTPGKITRKHTLFHDKFHPDCLHLIGGKLTTFPVVAKQVCDWLDKEERKNTTKLGWSGKSPSEKSKFVQKKEPIPIGQSLISFYGKDILTSSGSEPGKKESEITLVDEIIFAFEKEMGFTWPDVMERRTCLSQKIGNNSFELEKLRTMLFSAGLFKDKAGIDFNAYLEELNRNRFLQNI
ncbi:MAG: glycerol-3-phosphate dehydrogenase/oxidase [Bacteroidetes bacterium]|nr:glycerol-3-phosphate dehydrogenase/oxidase [Bacteroidota bacterium]